MRAPLCFLRSLFCAALKVDRCFQIRRRPPPTSNIDGCAETRRRQSIFPRRAGHTTRGDILLLPLTLDSSALVPRAIPHTLCSTSEAIYLVIHPTSDDINDDSNDDIIHSLSTVLRRDSLFPRRHLPLRVYAPSIADKIHSRCRCCDRTSTHLLGDTRLSRRRTVACHKLSRILQTTVSELVGSSSSPLLRWPSSTGYPHRPPLSSRLCGLSLRDAALQLL